MAIARQVQMPPEFEAGPEMAGKLCSICQTSVLAGERVVSCPHCALPFHAECWAENRGCSAYGCKGTPPTEKVNVATDVSSNAWAGEKPCPNCRKTIKGEALKCRFCGADFASRDVITSEEYSRREYEGKEYDSARNKIVALFLLSAAACLSPIALILCIILIVNKEFMGIDYNRLPMTLKAVVISSIGISSLLVIFMFLAMMLDNG